MLHIKPKIQTIESLLTVFATFKTPNPFRLKMKHTTEENMTALSTSAESCCVTMPALLLATALKKTHLMYSIQKTALHTA